MIAHLKEVVVDFLSSAKSKRVLVATLTAFIIAGGREWFGMDDETTTKLAGLAAALIVSDSLRPVSRVTNGEE